MAASEPVDRCPRCGDTNCTAEAGGAELQLKCRDRELANLRAYHRGIIRKVERIQEQLTDIVEALS